MKNFKNKCWHLRKVVVLCNTSLRKTPQRHRKSRMQTSEMRTAPINKNKKVEKSCWQTEKAVIWYQSCSGRETTEKQLKNLDNWTVKQPWKFKYILSFQNQQDWFLKILLKFSLNVSYRRNTSKRTHIYFKYEVLNWTD